tara:strand:- start:1993 stop:2187 length:195 start_codon:yes stop_codon:yes gene_type:complete
MIVEKKFVKEWLGTDNPLKESIIVIHELVNGEYTIDSLRQDIIEYCEIKEEWTKDKIIHDEEVK